MVFLLFHFLPFHPPCLSEVSAAALWLPAALSSGCFLALTWPQCSSWAATVLIFLSWAAHMLTHRLTEPLIGDAPLETLVIWPPLMWSRTWIPHTFVQLSPRPVTPPNLTVKLCFWFLPLSDMGICEQPFLAGFTTWIMRIIPSAEEGVLYREGLIVAEWAVLCAVGVVRRAAKSLCFSACSFLLLSHKRYSSFCSGPALQLYGSVRSIQLPESKGTPSLLLLLHFHC